MLWIRGRVVFMDRLPSVLQHGFNKLTQVTSAAAAFLTFSLLACDFSMCKVSVSHTTSTLILHLYLVADMRLSAT